MAICQSLNRTDNLCEYQCFNNTSDGKWKYLHYLNSTKCSLEPPKYIYHSIYKYYDLGLLGIEIVLFPRFLELLEQLFSEYRGLLSHF